MKLLLFATVAMLPSVAMAQQYLLDHNGTPRAIGGPFGIPLLDANGLLPSTMLPGNLAGGATTVLYGNGPPTAGLGSPGAVYLDRTGYAEWLNVGGTWTQVALFNPPTAAPIPPPSNTTGSNTPATHQYLLAAGGGRLLLPDGGKIIIQ